MSELETVPKPPAARIASASPSGSVSASSAFQASQSPALGSGAGAARSRGSCRAMRGQAGSFRSRDVSIERPSPIGRRSTAPPSSPSFSHQASRLSAMARLNGRYARPSIRWSAAAAPAASAWSRASSTSSPRLRLPACGPSAPGRLRTPATTPASFMPSQLPPASRSSPAVTSSRSAQCRAGARQGRLAISSRLAAIDAGHACPGRRRIISVHTRRMRPARAARATRRATCPRRGWARRPSVRRGGISCSPNRRPRDRTPPGGPPRRRSGSYTPSFA